MTIAYIIFLALVGAIIAQLIGMAWYSKYIFGKAWMKAAGKTEDSIKKEMADKKVAVMKYYLPSFVAAFIYSLFIILAVRFSDGVTFAGMILTFALIVILFAGPIAYSAYVFEDRNKNLFFIHFGYSLVSVIVISGILTLLA